VKAKLLRFAALAVGLSSQAARSDAEDNRAQYPSFLSRSYFALEDGDGRSSRWNTLRALRVLR
jgi:hypothetical protein